MLPLSRNPSFWMMTFSYKQNALGRIYDPSKGFLYDDRQSASPFSFFSGIHIYEIRPQHISARA